MAIGYTCFATTSPGSLHGPWGLQKPIGDRGSPVCKLGLCIYYLSAWVYVLAKSNLCIYILLLITIIFIITIVFMILIIVIFVIVIINIIMYGAYIYIYTHTIIISIIITIIIILYYIYVCVRVSPGKSTINSYVSLFAFCALTWQHFWASLFSNFRLIQSTLQLHAKQNTRIVTSLHRWEPCIAMWRQLTSDNVNDMELRFLCLTNAVSSIFFTFVTNWIVFSP